MCSQSPPNQAACRVSCFFLKNGRKVVEKVVNDTFNTRYDLHSLER